MHPFSDWYSSRKEGYQRGVKSTRGRFFRRKSTHSFVRKTTRTSEKIDSWNQHYRRHMSKLFWTMIYIWQYAWYNQIQNILKHMDFLRLWEMVQQWWASRCGTAREPFFLLDTTTPQDDSDSRYIKFLKVILSTQQEQGFWKKAMLGISDLIALRTTFWNIWCPYQSDKKSHDKMMLFFMIRWFFELWKDVRLFRFAQLFTTFEIF